LSLSLINSIALKSCGSISLSWDSGAFRLSFGLSTVSAASSASAGPGVSFALGAVLVSELGGFEALLAGLVTLLLAQLVDGVLVDGLGFLADVALKGGHVHFGGAQADHTLALAVLQEALDLGEVGLGFGLFAGRAGALLLGVGLGLLVLESGEAVLAHADGRVNGSSLSLALLGGCILDLAALGTLQLGVGRVVVVAVQAQFAEPLGSHSGVGLPVGELRGALNGRAVCAASLALGHGAGLREGVAGQTGDAHLEFGALIQLLDTQIVVVGYQVVVALGTLLYGGLHALARLAGLILLALAAVAHAHVALGAPVACGVPGLVELLGAHRAGAHGCGAVALLARLARLTRLAGLAGLARLSVFALLSSVVSSLLPALLVEVGQAGFTPLSVFRLEGELVGAVFVCVEGLGAVDALVGLVVLVQDADQGFTVEHGLARLLLGCQVLLVGQAEVGLHR